MSDLDPTAQLADLHAALAADLDTVLDVEAGLREVMIGAHHTRLSAQLDDTLDPAAGLDAIVPAGEPSPTPHRPTSPAPPETTGPPPDVVRGAVARLLVSLDTPSRLFTRDHPAVDALAIVFAVVRTRIHHVDLVTALERLGKLRKSRRSIAQAAQARGDVYTTADAIIGQLQPIMTRVASLRTFTGRTLVNPDDLAEAGTRVGSIAHTVNRALVHNSFEADLAGVLRNARAVDQALTRAFDDACRYAGALAAVTGRADARGVDLSQAVARDVMTVRDSLVDLGGDLDRARHDFTTADLRGIDLTRVRLDRLRWSAATRWPSDDWRDQAVLDSIQVAPGVYEIRGGTTHVPTHIT